MVNRGSLLEPKSVKFLQLALRGAAEGCSHPWFQFCRGVERTRLTVRSDSTLICQNEGSSPSLKLALSAFCLFQPRFYFRHFPNTHPLTGISSKLLALRKRTEKVSRKQHHKGCFALTCFFVAGSIWLRYRLFSCGYLSSSSPCFQSGFNTLARPVSYARLILHLLSGSPEILWRQI